LQCQTRDVPLSHHLVGLEFMYLALLVSKKYTFFLGWKSYLVCNQNLAKFDNGWERNFMDDFVIKLGIFYFSKMKYSKWNNYTTQPAIQLWCYSTMVVKFSYQGVGSSYGWCNGQL
jgi:hypothetical protein